MHSGVTALSGLSPCRMDFAHMYQVYKSRRGIKRSEDSKVGASLGTPFLSPSRALSFQEKFACLKVGWGFRDVMSLLSQVSDLGKKGQRR